MRGEPYEPSLGRGRRVEGLGEGRLSEDGLSAASAIAWGALRSGRMEQVCTRRFKKGGRHVLGYVSSCPGFSLPEWEPKRTWGTQGL